MTFSMFRELSVLLFLNAAHVAIAGVAGFTSRPVVQAQPVTATVSLGAWAKAGPAYAFSLMRNDHEVSTAPIEGGSVRFAYDHTHLHVFFTLQDHDIVQESDEDQRIHFKTGDVVELFLKPEGASWYWEFHATPNARKTVFFFPSRGYRGLPSARDYRSGLKVSAGINGTLNNWHDRDSGWTAQMHIPLAELAEAGVPLNKETPWRVLVGRYNYGRYLPALELSMFPALTKLDFHRYEEWAHLKLIAAPSEGADNR